MKFNLSGLFYCLAVVTCGSCNLVPLRDLELCQLDMVQLDADLRQCHLSKKSLSHTIQMKSEAEFHEKGLDSTLKLEHTIQDLQQQFEMVLNREANLQNTLQQIPHQCEARVMACEVHAEELKLKLQTFEMEGAEVEPDLDRFDNPSSELTMGRKDDPSTSAAATPTRGEDLSNPEFTYQPEDRCSCLLFGLPPLYYYVALMTVFGTFLFLIILYFVLLVGYIRRGKELRRVKSQTPVTPRQLRSQPIYDVEASEENVEDVTAPAHDIGNYNAKITSNVKSELSSQKL